MTRAYHSNLRLYERRLSGRGVPVVLLGGINVLRAFGLAGVPVVVATADPRSPAVASKYCSGVLRLPSTGSPSATVEALIRAGDFLARRGYPPSPLFCGEDRFLRILHEYREALSSRFRLVLNDAAIAQSLTDKSLFQQLAADMSLPIPREIEPHELAGFSGRVLAKPKSKPSTDEKAQFENFFGHVAKARVFDSGAEAAQDRLAASLSDRLIFQQYIAGDDQRIWSFHGFADENGVLLEWFIGRKIRTYPPITGESSLLELTYDADLERLGRQIVARVPLKGFFKIDFKRSATDNQFYMLEVNARCNLWLYLGAANGVNLARVAYDYVVCGKQPEHVKAATKYRWLCLRLDYLAYRELAAQGRLPLKDWLRSLARWHNVYSLFSWSDPLPFAMQQWGRMTRLARRLRRRH